MDWLADFGPVVLITAHGSVSGRSTAVDHYQHRVIHPCPVELTVDVLLQNLILKLFTSAQTAQDLLLLRQMIEEIPSTFTVLSDRAPRNSRESQTLLQHRISPAQLEMPFIFSPHDHHNEYFAYRVLDRPSSNIQVSFLVHINRRKLFEQVANSIGDDSTLENNHAIFLKPIVQPESTNFVFLSEMIDEVLQRMVISVVRPTDVRGYLGRAELFDAMDVALVYLECDDDYQDQALQENLAELDLDVVVEIHKVRLPASCTIIPVICRRSNPSY
jgi:hypothetical protein